MGSGAPWWSLPRIPNWEGKRALCKGELSFRKVWVGWESGPNRTLWSSAKITEGLAPGKTYSRSLVQTGIYPPRNSSVERCLGVLVDKQMNLGEWCATVAKQANRFLDCINKGLTSSDKKVIFPFCSALIRPHLEHCVQFWSLIYKNKACRVWKRSREGLQRWWKDWEAWHVRLRWEN